MEKEKHDRIELLRSYLDNPNDTNKRKVIEAYLPRLLKIAKRRATYLNVGSRGKYLPRINVLDSADLTGWGYLGLLAAIDCIDSKQLRFADTYIDRRIDGAISDGLRAPNRIRNRWTLRTGSEWVQLDGLTDGVGYKVELPASNPPIGKALEEDEAFQALIAQMPERDQQMHRRYYKDGWTLYEIGKELGISESAVSLAMKRRMVELRKQHGACDPKETIHRRNQQTGGRKNG